MGLFSGGNKSERHETPCPKGTTPRNRMGWGSDKPRVVKETRPKMHGTRAERRLASGTGGLIKQDATRVRVRSERVRRTAASTRWRD